MPKLICDARTDEENGIRREEIVDMEGITQSFDGRSDAANDIIRREKMDDTERIVHSFYPSLMRRMGLSDASCFFSSFFKITLLALYILQMIPCSWLAMNFFIIYKAWKIGVDEDVVEKESRNSMTKKSKIIFSLLEDTPQIILHSLFLSNSVTAHDNPVTYAGIDMLNIGSFLGVASSAASIALTLTLFKSLPTYKGTVIQFITTFISVGTRATVCASYAVSVLNGFGPRTWPMVLPLVTAIGLCTIEYILLHGFTFLAGLRQNLIVNFTLINRAGFIKYIKENTQSFYETVTHLNYYECIILIQKYVDKIVKCIVSLTFEASSVQCLISSYTYISFAIVINTNWISASEDTDINFSMTQTYLIVIQYLAFASFIINLYIVQWEGKNKVRCLSYSFIFLMFIGGIYIWIKNDFESFSSLFVGSIATDYFYSQEAINISLSSLTIVLYISGIIVIFNLLIIMYGLSKDFLAIVAALQCL
ncbi:unnamed protein product [Meganyctiphanes norvegica]|uniref:Odorant receptor n=1 Tax=Meganyctiphanes norvegica TaxID=48144 RepID=A0AAV2PIK6_MEGNR